MYESHFNLTRRPFSRVPSAIGCVMYPGIESAVERIQDGINAGSGPALVVAPSGCGKSTLLALLERRFADVFAVVNLNCAVIDSRRELIQCLLYELGLPFSSDNVGELRLKLIDHLKQSDQFPNGLLLLVDEGQNLPMEVLEELRMITNMVCGAKHQIRLVIAGTRPLEEKLGHPRLESFSQRISVRCYLQKMTRTETMYFALAQMQMAGRDGRDIFQPSALDKIFDITDGVPRLVSHLCDHALKMAAGNNQDRIDAKQVQSAWLDLQQLPDSPEPEDFPGSSEGGIIEFGSLEDSLDESQAGFEGQAHEFDSAGQFAESSDLPIEGITSESELASESGLASEVLSPQPDETEEPASSESFYEGAIEVDTDAPTESTIDILLKQLGHLKEGSVHHEVEQQVDLTAQAETELQSLTEALRTARENSQSDFSIEVPEMAAERPSEADVARALEELESVFHGDATDLSQANEGDPAQESGVSENLATPQESRVEEWDALQSGQVSVTDTNSAFLTSSISTDELFGDSFEEEQVVDAQSSMLAEQNRISSGMTAQELSELKPEEPEAAHAGPLIEIGTQHGTDENRASLHPEATLATDAGQDVQSPPIDKDAEVSTAASDDLESAVDHESQSVPPSQGQVIRMDYQDLFEQLRSGNTNSQT